ncbi:uncharacterized protein ACR2FA_011953 [Aphomia sociella]
MLQLLGAEKREKISERTLSKIKADGRDETRKFTKQYGNVSIITHSYDKMQRAAISMSISYSANIMELTEIFLIILYIRTALPKKHILSSSEESIENLIYYKDCNHKRSTTPLIARAEVPPPTPPKPDCPFPKMCCTMSCGNECVSNQQSFLSRQMEPLQNLMPMPAIPPAPRQPHPAVQPQIQQRGRKKKLKQQSKLQPPTGGRRDFGFTKERIKSLIAQDADIRNILKDLVRVTMQKVDLLEMINARRNANIKSEKSNDSYEEYED